MNISKLDYCQFLLSSQINYTLTHVADHLQSFSHDTINRYLRGEKLSPLLLWEQVQPTLEPDPQTYVVFDDTVLDRSFGPHIEMVRRQWSGNQKSVIRGIGLVTCVYVNPRAEQFWVTDYRIFDPDTDGKSNRLVDDSEGEKRYRRIEALNWNQVELAGGKRVKVKGFPGDYKMKLFRVEVSARRTEWVVTNDLSQSSTRDTQEVSALRWKIEEFHREAKQLTGLEDCQCRKARVQRNHIACSLLVWVRLKTLAYQTGQTVYQLKYPAIKMVLA